jgi:pectinesterase
VYSNLTYSDKDDTPLKLDLYRPKYDREPLPAILCIHGGGWARGSRISMNRIAEILAYNGFIAVPIDYRLSGLAIFPAQIQDCKEAVRWLRINADRFGIDASKIGAIGHSAGAHLAALLATSSGSEGTGGEQDIQKISDEINAAVAIGGQTDFLSERIKTVSAHPEWGRIWRQFLGGTQAEKPELYRLASPLQHLDRGDPPIAFITGERDEPSTRAETFRERADEIGVQTHLMIIPDAPHDIYQNPEWVDLVAQWSSYFFRDILR